MSSSKLSKSDLSLTGCVADYDIFVEFDEVINIAGECWITFTKHRTALKPGDSDWPIGKYSLKYIQREKNHMSFHFEDDPGSSRGAYSMNNTYNLEILTIVQIMERGFQECVLRVWINSLLLIIVTVICLRILGDGWGQIGFVATIYFGLKLHLECGESDQR